MVTSADHIKRVGVSLKRATASAPKAAGKPGPVAARRSQPRQVGQTYLLGHAASRQKAFLPLSPTIVSTVGELRASLKVAKANSLWISCEKGLTNALLQSRRSFQAVVVLHPIRPESLPPLASCFDRFSFVAENGAVLPDGELAAALNASNRYELLIGGSIDHSSQTVTFWRGNIKSLTVPLTAFDTEGDGVEPDFTKFSITDFGHTVRFGKYEAAADAILYEFDADYRRRIAKVRQVGEKSFGASLRRLRKQRGLRREDFGPSISAKTIARIEQGKVQRVQSRTVEAIARRLGVQANEIRSY